MLKQRKTQPKRKQRKRGKIGPPHPWRLCPLGEHWVRKHPLHIPPSKKNPSGSVTDRDGHCRKNQSHKDTIYPIELLEIANQYFASLEGSPNRDDLGFPNGNKYDDLIRGWVKYWNEVLNPKDPLDPDLVKALIATESEFNPEAKPPGGSSNAARGLMQITNKTRKILGDDKGEMSDHIVKIERNEVTDPNLNIAAGVRWLFRKKEIAESKLGKKATWRDAVAEFKDYDDDPNHTQMKKFDEMYKRLKKK